MSEWKLDVARSAQTLSESFWVPVYQTSLQCSPYKHVLTMFISTPKTLHQDIRSSVINCLRKPWRVFGYDLLGADKTPICSEKGYLDSLSNDLDMVPPREWLAAKHSFEFLGTTYGTDFFTPLNADVFRFELRGYYELKAADGTIENYHAGRELIGETELLNVESDPNLWVDNTFFVECHGNDPDDIFTSNVNRIASLFERMGNYGVYFPFNLQADLPQKSGYISMRVNIQVVLNIQNVYTTLKTFFSTFPLDVERAPNSYHTTDLDFSMVRDDHVQQITGSCYSDWVIHGRVSSKLLDAGRKLGALLQNMAQICAQNKIQVVNDLQGLRENLQTCIKLLYASGNSQMEQSEGFLQLSELVQATADIVQKVKLTNPKLTQLDGWNSILTDELSLTTLRNMAGPEVYKPEMTTMARPLYDKPRQARAKVDLKFNNLVKQNPNSLLAVNLAGIFLTVFLFMLCLGHFVHSRLKPVRK